MGCVLRYIFQLIHYRINMSAFNTLWVLQYLINNKIKQILKFDQIYIKSLNEKPKLSGNVENFVWCKSQPVISYIFRNKMLGNFYLEW